MKSTITATSCADDECYLLAYENEAKYPGEVIKVRSFKVQGVARHVIKAL